MVALAILLTHVMLCMLYTFSKHLVCASTIANKELDWRQVRFCWIRVPRTRSLVRDNIYHIPFSHVFHRKFEPDRFFGLLALRLKNESTATYEDILNVVDRCSKRVTGTLLDERSFFRDWRGAVNPRWSDHNVCGAVQIYVRSRNRLGYIWTKESTMQQCSSERALKSHVTLEEPTSLYADQSDLPGVRTKQDELRILAKWAKSLHDRRQGTHP